jgi:hypothetical protein
MNSMPGMAVKAFVISLAFLPLTVMAQDNSAATAGSPGCGNDSIKFSVKTDKAQHPSQPQTGNALIYFIEDDSNFNSASKPTTRAGLDGKWVGATHGNSYLSFSVDPGVHHLCASWQPGAHPHPLISVLTGVSIGQDSKSAALHFTAEAGSTYYFKVRNIAFSTESSTKIDLTLTPLDSDEGQLLVNKSAHSTSVQKK